MDNITKSQIISLIHQEVIPAIGCTEPVAVALAAAKAAEVLGERPEKIDVLLSANILKNAMGVGIPGTGMVGLPIAIALGTLIGKSSYELEVLRDITPEAFTGRKSHDRRKDHPYCPEGTCRQVIYRSDLHGRRPDFPGYYLP